MDNAENIVIDLTSSFSLCEHSSLTDAIIVIDSDDSFDNSSESKKKKKKKSDSKNEKNLIKEKTVSPSKNKPTDSNSTTGKFGNCAICWEELGKNPLASTKCGHVFCFTCLEKSLKFRNSCPSCRCVLKGKTAYHPLYFSKLQ